MFHFRLCTPFNATNTKDVANLFESIIGNFMDVVQYNRDNREFEGIRIPRFRGLAQMTKACGLIQL